MFKKSKMRLTAGQVFCQTKISHKFKVVLITLIYITSVCYSKHSIYSTRRLVKETVVYTMQREDQPLLVSTGTDPDFGIVEQSVRREERSKQTQNGFGLHSGTKSTDGRRRVVDKQSLRRTQRDGP